jgi:hypothetical protein
MQRENEIVATIVDAAYQIHRTFGPDLLESAYKLGVPSFATFAPLRVTDYPSVTFLKPGKRRANTTDECSTRTFTHEKSP